MPKTKKSIKKIGLTKELYEQGLSYNDIRKFDRTMKNLSYNAEQIMRRNIRGGAWVGLAPITRQDLLESLKHGANFETIINDYKRENSAYREAKNSFYNSKEANALYEGLMHDLEAFTGGKVKVTYNQLEGLSPEIINRIERLCSNPESLMETFTAREFANLVNEYFNPLEYVYFYDIIHSIIRIGY